MRNLILSMTMLLSTTVFSQVVVTRPVTIVAPRPVLTQVAVKKEYSGARLTNRGLYYVNNKKNVSDYFADEGDSELVFESLNQNAKNKFSILINEIKRYEDKFNPNTLKDLIDAAYESGYRDGLASVDMDALVQLVMNHVAKETSQELRDVLNEMDKMNRSKRQQRETTNKLKKQLSDCLRTVTCPIRARQALEVQIQASTKKQDELDQMGEMQQLRMQMILDRMQRANQSLSNLLKKLSEVMQGIVQNIK